MSENTPEPDPELVADVESAFHDEAEPRNPLDDLVVLEIVVRLPAKVAPDGNATAIGYRRLVIPEAVRMANIEKVLPRELERLVRILELSLRFSG